jgi:hypothetical protein
LTPGLAPRHHCAVRKPITLLLLALAGCIPSGKGPPPPRPAGTPAQPDRAALQCRADLAREGVKFKVLPDRVFGGGCSAIGTVQLLDIGLPTRNLGAMTCPLARSFARWTREAVEPTAKAWLGSPVVRIDSFGTYSCRPVNNEPGGKLSEHGRSNAVDVSGFVLADGRRITILDGWNGSDDDVRRFLRSVHDAGCRRFSVGLGPDANAYHRNHLHFDMGRGPYCR